MLTNSNIFLKDHINEIITIIKIKKATLLFDNKKLLNLFNLKGDVFGVPFIFDFNSKNNSVINQKIDFKVESLKLNIFNESIFKNDSVITGINIISFFNSKIITKYNLKKKIITFTSEDSRLNNLKIDYKGKMSINPFDLNMNIDLGNHKIYKLFNVHPILKAFIESKLLFNDNLSLNILMHAKTSLKDQIFHNAKINFSIINGKINLDSTVFTNDDIGLIELRNSDLFLKNGELILNTDILVSIKDSKYLFSFLNTSKKSRKNIKNVLINLSYNFLSNQIKFNKIKVDDNEVKDSFLNIVDNFEDNNLNNLIKTRRLLNKLFNIYEG